MSTRAFEVTTRTAVVTPALGLEPMRSLGAVVPVDTTPVTTPTVNRYDHAVALVDATRASLKKAVERTAPRTLLGPVDQWFARHTGFAVTGAAITGLWTFATASFSMAAAQHPRGATVAAVFGALTVLGGAATFLMASARLRTSLGRDLRDWRALESTDLEDMLASFSARPLSDRVILADFVRADLAHLDEDMSPKAAERRDEVLGTAVPVGREDAQLRRAGELARAIRAVRDGVNVKGYDPFAAIERVIDEAPREEREQIAATLQKMLFRGERPTFKGSIELQRRVYAAMRKAERGGPINTEEP